MDISRDTIISALQSVIDPEIYIDIWTLGLIYDIRIFADGLVNIVMTLTSMSCPAGPYLAQEVRDRLSKVDGVREAVVEIVFDPPWQAPEDLRAMMGLD